MRNLLTIDVAVFVSAIILFGDWQLSVLGQNSEPGASDPRAIARTSEAETSDLDHGQEVTLEGKVVTPDGRPVGGAAIYLALSDNWSFIKRGYGVRQGTPELLGTSIADGTFRVTANRLDVDAQHVSNATLIAIPPKGSRLGVDWSETPAFVVDKDVLRDKPEKIHELAKESADSRTLQLSDDDIPLEGRIVDEDGTPVVGARVRVANIQQVRNNDLSGILEVARRGNPRDYDKARIENVTKNFFGELGRRDGFGDLLAATTDDDGRFTIEGFGRDRIGWLAVEHDQIVRDRILVRTALGATLVMQDGDASFPFYPARFEHPTIPSSPIEGTIVDQESREPIVGVVVENLYLFPQGDRKRTMEQGDCMDTTDEQGRFRLTGLPTATMHQNLCLLATAQHSPHLPRFHWVDVASGKDVDTADLQLMRGEWIEGRVFNIQSNLPVPSHLHYFVFRDNPKAKSAPGFEGILSYPTRPPYLTDMRGEYRIPGVPGRGIVTAKAIADLSGNRYLPNRGQEGIEGSLYSGIWSNYDTLPSECRVSSFHGVREVHVSQGQPLTSQDLALTPSITLKGTILDPDGNPLLGVKYAGHGVKNFNMHPLNGAEFEVVDYDPTYPRRLLFTHLERQLAATVVLEGDHNPPLEVTLEHSGSLVGRVLDDNGRPLSGVLLVGAPFAAPNPPTTITALPEPNYTTDQDGRFRIDGLAPGMRYSLTTRLPNGRLRVVVLNATVEGGETTDVGDVKPMPLDRLRMIDHSK